MANSKFQTTVEIPEFSWELAYSKKHLFMGSCFTENIGKRMLDLNYDVDINPFGILYNPMSVARGLKILLQNKALTKNDLIQYDGLWHSFFHHGKFSAPEINHTLGAINNQINYSSANLKNADFLFITFGTAWVYKHKSTGVTVSNCHKIPAREFDRVRLTVNEIVELYQNILNEIRKLNPDVKIIFTVSPIRHWKDGAIENQRSKSILLLAVDEIIKDSNNNSVYFPSYEIIMDELRDYRFYASDMIHISDVAIDHIWNKFEQALITKDSQEISKKIKKIKAAVYHRPFNKFTKEHLQFLKKQLINTIQLVEKFPFINLDEEKDSFTYQINEIEGKVGNR